MASWYLRPGDILETLENFDFLFREQLDKIRNKYKGNKPPSVHVLGDVSFRDIVWPDRVNKSGPSLRQLERQSIMNNHELEQLINFPTREGNTLDSIMTSLPAQFVEIHFPFRLIDDIVSGTLKVVIPPLRNLGGRVYRYQKGDFESMRTESLKFAKEKYFNGYSDARSLQENFNLITSFIQNSADKHILSQTSCTVDNT